MGEAAAAKTTAFKFENNVLCATFPEMGVALNSMVDRRQLATRYAVQVEVALNIDNKLIVNHVVLSHPFLIAITNDQTEPLLYSIFWSRLQATEQNDAAELYYESSTITWSVLRQAIANYVKSQVVHARVLHYHEICHVQCMILLPRVLRCKESNELDALELALYGNTKGSSSKPRLVELRNRLLTEQILPTTLIERREFMVDKCYSSMDMSTELPHTVWAWLFRATEMLQDIGHKLCPSPNLGEKKGTKTKRQMAACEEYQTMLSLFNKGLITFASSLCVKKLLQDVAATLGNDAILIRICDENVGFLSFVFGFEEGSSDILRMGSISAEQVKDFKQGLPEMLIDEQFPAKFSYLIKIEAHSSDCYDATVSLTRKRSIFHSYETMRLDSTVHVHDSESIRINPLTGEKVPRVSRATDSTANELGAVSYVEPLSQFTSLPSVSNALLSLLQQQMALPIPHFAQEFSSGFDIRSLLLNIRLPETNGESHSEGEKEFDGTPTTATTAILHDDNSSGGGRDERSSDETQ
ncbi:hypothetical protein Q1695_013900 [Nippostrongylus brasiliensis]|nr:hypothetical protein Q1695_013900 [Nippostrongylus brasiliensis]